jgi:hypothetical protein
MKNISRWCISIVVLFSFTLAFVGFWSRTIAIPDIATATMQGHSIPSRSLTSQQVARLVVWFKAHDNGWQGLMETPPAPITMDIAMSGGNDQQSVLTLFKVQDGATTAFFYPPRPASPLKRALSTADVTDLLAAVEN